MDLQWCTPPLPGGPNSIATGVAPDAAGHAYVSGYAQNIPLVSPIQTGKNAFVSVLNSTGTAFTFSTALPQDARAMSIGIDSVPNIHVAGSASNSGSPFPVLHATYVVPNPPSFASPGFLSKISLSPGIALSLPVAVDFTQNGLVIGRDSVSVQLLVANPSASSSISIGDIAITASDFTQTNNCLTTLGPTTDCIVSVTLAPTVAGNRTGIITITDTAPGSPHTISLTGTGLVPPGAAVNPTSLTFAAQTVGTSSGPQQVTLTNLSNVPLVVSKVAASGDFSASGNCNSVPPPAAGGNNCPISVFFSPTASGNRTGVLTISFGATGAPQTVNLSGQGVNASLGLTVPQGSDSTAVVAAGASASYTLSIGGAGMSGMASLTCTGAPQGAACTLPNPLTVDANTPAHFNVNISTTSRAIAALGACRSGWFWAAAIFGLAVPPWSPSKKKTASRYLPLAMVVALLLPSCGGGGSSNNGPPPNPNGTPAGTYTLTVAATVGSNVQSTSLTLTVQ